MLRYPWGEIFPAAQFSVLSGTDSTRGAAQAFGRRSRPDPTRLCSLMFSILLASILAPVPVHRLRCHSRPTLVLSCASHPLSRVLRGSPYGKQGQKSAADLRKVLFLPPSAQVCGQKPKRISHRYRQLRVK